MLIVMKFGGTSVGSAERIAQAAALVTASRNKGHQVAAVTSAMSGVTNSLIEAAQAASKGTPDSTLRQRLLPSFRTETYARRRSSRSIGGSIASRSSVTGCRWSTS